MVKLRIVLVEPEYEINLGAVARLMRNFGQGRLYIVNPRCEIGFTARMHAKHAEGVLADAKICKSAEEALKGCRLVAGTTGVLRRHRKLLRNPLSPKELSARVEKNAPGAEVALLFGREGIGLSASEIQLCDLLCTIPTSLDYPVMNLSHAVAVMLYALSAEGKKPARPKDDATAGEMDALQKTLAMLVDRQKGHIRNMPKTKLAFRTVIGRAVPTGVELRCMLGVLRTTLKELESRH